MQLAKYLQTLAIRSALRRPAPDIIPSNPEKVRGRNYYTVLLCDSDGTPRFYAQSQSRNGLSGTFFHDNAGGFEASIPWKWASEFEVRITSYFHEWERQDAEPWKFLLNYYTVKPRIEIYLGRFSQALFNRRKLVRGDRILVLRLFLHETLRNDKFEVGPSGVLQKMYGFRWMHHPDSVRTMQYYRLVLDSLVASEDLKQSDSRYKLAPKALWSLAKFEEENRKHRDSMRSQWILASLTFGLILVGLIQAAVGMWGNAD